MDSRITQIIQATEGTAVFHVWLLEGCQLLMLWRTLESELAKMFSEGRWTHDDAIDFKQAKKWGLPVSDQMSEKIYQLMQLHPQARQKRPGADFIPMPHRIPAAPGKAEKLHGA